MALSGRSEEALPTKTSTTVETLIKVGDPCYSYNYLHYFLIGLLQCVALEDNFETATSSECRSPHADW